MLAAGCSGSSTAAQDAAIRVPVDQFTLDNGLAVILHRDTTSPIIETNIWYHVGSANEQPGRTGFAHLFEHIMFEGSKNVPEGRIDEWFEEVGGAPNGSTAPDRTNYMQTFASNALDMALFIESDRMGWLLDAMSPASVDGQRDVVKNERRQSYDNRPYGLAGQILNEELFPADHPYHWPVIGYMDDLSAASYEDVREFFRRYYAPNNASLVIAGDFEVAEARRLVDRWFGEIPRGEPVPRLEATLPVRTSAERVMLEDRVQLPRLVMAWVTPPAYADGNADLDALADLLASGKNSRLFKRLVYELQIADDVSAVNATARLASQFHITATARAGHNLAELDSVILEEIDKLRTAPAEAAELSRVVNQVEVGFYEGLERIDAKADQLNEYLYHTGEPDFFQRELDRLRAVTPATILAAAERYLDPDTRVVLSIVPEGNTVLALPESRPIPRENIAQSPRAR
ncbi:MAG: M16 family metallopeptidase [Longimicrobiales bacterium]